MLLDAYKCVMNTKDFRDKIIGGVIKDNSILEFAGSFCFFDPCNKTLADSYRETCPTEGRSYSSVLEDVKKILKKQNDKYVAISLTVIISSGDVSHTAVLIFPSDKKTVKCLDSSLSFFMSRYRELMKNFARDCGYEEVMYPPVCEQGIFRGCGVQDICRYDEFMVLKRYIDEYYDDRYDCFCQTWCVFMLFHEVQKMRENYLFEKNYLVDLPNRRKDLVKLLLAFIKKLIRNNRQMFDREFDESGIKYQEVNNILLSF